MKFISIFLLTFSFTVAFAAQEMSFDKIVSLPLGLGVEKTFDVSVYVSEKSNWNEGEILKRLKTANQALISCNIGMRHVYVHKWLPSNPKLRVDDFRSDKLYYDGIRHAGVQSKKATNVQLFYFEDYLESFTSGPSVPLAVYPDDKVVPEAFNTAWFPYKSAQRFKNAEVFYNEEAHELGHVLLKRGHDHSGESNILANNSKLRSLQFSVDQCEDLGKSKFLNSSPALDFHALFSTYYQKYSNRYYMTDWCSRNTHNLAKEFDKLFDLNKHKVYTLYVVHKTKGQSFAPSNARAGVVRWKFHAFLVVDGYVLDLDFGKKPFIVKLDQYLAKMLPGVIDDLKFQVRGPLDIPGYTYLEVAESFDQKEAKILNADELINFFH